MTAIYVAASRRMKGGPATLLNLSKPLGFSSYQTKAALKDVRYRVLKPGE